MSEPSIIENCETAEEQLDFVQAGIYAFLDKKYAEWQKTSALLSKAEWLDIVDLVRMSVPGPHRDRILGLGSAWEAAAIRRIDVDEMLRKVFGRPSLGEERSRLAASPKRKQIRKRVG